MRFSAIVFSIFLSLLSEGSAAESSTPADRWYLSFTNTFEYCVSTQFKSVLCPSITIEDRLLTQIPKGELNPTTLLQAKESYRAQKSPKEWLDALHLEKIKLGNDIQNSRDLLVASAKWLLAEILFDERQFEAADKIYEEILPYFRGKAKFHQERAWVKYFRGQFQYALGSIMSAGSPLVYPIPFIDKYFLTALIERDSCQYTKALATLAEGRAQLELSLKAADRSPWVKACQNLKLGATCDRLAEWARQNIQKEIDQAKIDLNFIELELADKGFRVDSRPAVAAVVWPYVGEKWGDELGHYRVEVPEKCTQN